MVAFLLVILIISCGCHSCSEATIPNPVDTGTEIIEEEQEELTVEPMEPIVIDTTQTIKQ